MWTSVSPWSRVGPPRVRGKDLAGDENRGGGSLAAPPPPASAAHNERLAEFQRVMRERFLAGPRTPLPFHFSSMSRPHSPLVPGL